MTPKFVGTLMLVVVAACFATGVIVYPHLPLMAVSHWSVHGEPNGHLARAWAAFLLPGMMLLFYGLWAFLPRLDPIGNIKKFRYVYDFVWFLILAFLAYVYALMLGANLGWQFNTLTAILPALAVLIFALGSLMPYLHRNWFVGIRTPWTLSSDSVWAKTHKLGGLLFQAAGVLILIATFAPVGIRIWLIVGPLVVAILWSVVYSYVIYERERH
jgi:uncharacterized membrane protein